MGALSLKRITASVIAGTSSGLGEHQHMHPMRKAGTSRIVEDNGRGTDTRRSNHTSKFRRHTMHCSLCCRSTLCAYVRCLGCLRLHEGFLCLLWRSGVSSDTMSPVYGGRGIQSVRRISITAKSSARTTIGALDAVVLQLHKATAVQRPPLPLFLQRRGQASVCTEQPFETVTASLRFAWNTTHDPDAWPVWRLRNCRGSRWMGKHNVTALTPCLVLTTVFLLLLRLMSLLLASHVRLCVLLCALRLRPRSRILFFLACSCLACSCNRFLSSRALTSACRRSCPRCASCSRTGASVSNSDRFFICSCACLFHSLGPRWKVQYKSEKSVHTIAPVTLATSVTASVMLSTVEPTKRSMAWAIR